MAQEMNDLEFLLPSELLTDDDLLNDFTCGFGYSSGLSSDLSSPVESVTGTTDTGSDVDDFVSELTRKLSNSTLTLSGSPQSTLHGFKPDSSDSPNSYSPVCFHNDAKDALTLDLLHAAAEDVARMRMVEETAAFYATRLFAQSQKHSPLTVPPYKPNPVSVFYSNQAQTQTLLTYQQLLAANFQQRKQQQMMKNGFLVQGNVRFDGGGYIAYDLPKSAWPTLQQSQEQNSSCMKPGFLADTWQKKERVGTGVFMPRRFCSNPTETSKKPAERAAHSLNLNIHSIDAHLQHRVVGNFSNDNDVFLKHRNNEILAHQSGNPRPQPLVNQEFRLPQEWSY